MFELAVHVCVCNVLEHQGRQVCETTSFDNVCLALAAIHIVQFGVEMHSCNLILCLLLLLYR